jgi:hypothetical protein
MSIRFNSISATECRLLKKHVAGLIPVCSFIPFQNSKQCTCPNAGITHLLLQSLQQAKVCGAGYVAGHPCAMREFTRHWYIPTNSILTGPLV